MTLNYNLQINIFDVWELTSWGLSLIQKNVIFPRYGVPRVLISDGGTHFTGNSFRKCLSKLGIEHRVATAYHPQTNGQV
jgi:transposase InsO family protein